jgi:hypothetical protein
MALDVGRFWRFVGIIEAGEMMGLARSRASHSGVDAVFLQCIEQCAGLEQSATLGGS